MLPTGLAMRNAFADNIETGIFTVLAVLLLYLAIRRVRRLA
jgi:hypothetical protein